MKLKTIPLFYFMVNICIEKIAFYGAIFFTKIFINMLTSCYASDNIITVIITDFKEET